MVKQAQLESNVTRSGTRLISHGWSTGAVASCTMATLRASTAGVPWRRRRARELTIELLEPIIVSEAEEC
jgi:hypothetical protein